MKKIKKILPIVLVFTLSLLFVFTASADVETDRFDIIYGIDYDRITQKTGGTEKHRVELKLGDLTFTGELSGEFGLSMKELNEIIRETLTEKNLSVEQVVAINQLAHQLQNRATAVWGEQSLEALLSIITIPGVPITPGDVYAYFKKDDVLPAVTSNSITAAQMAVEKSMEVTLKAGKVAGRVTKAGAKAVPILGSVVSTAITAKGLKEGEQQFEEFLSGVEKTLEVANDFYATCSRKAVALAEKNDSQNIWKIKFPQTTQQYECTIWGIPKNTMRLTVKGELVNGSAGMAGDYTGTISLEFDKEDISPLETHLEDTPGFAQVKSVLYSYGAYQKIQDEAQTVSVLRRSVEAKMTLHVDETKGKVIVRGTAELLKDDTSFMLNRIMEWRDDSAAAIGGVGYTEIKVDAFDLSKMTLISSSRVEYKGKVEEQVDDVNDFAQDPGTVFAPIDVNPVIQIDFTK
ncbi:MAG: hypothetical protein IKX04_03420 [Clostridiales bacterium]|nr:hypothetical protein [Clostridiales bacterium]